LLKENKLEKFILETDLAKGLSGDLAKEKLNRYGPNKLPEPPKMSLFMQFIDQFKSLLIIILLIAAIISAFFGEVIDTIVIIGITILNALLGVSQERRAEKALDAVKKLSNPKSKVIRDGSVRIIPSEEIVPGDILLLEAGDKVSCDGVVVESIGLTVDESTLTGESVSIIKSTFKDEGKMKEENMAFMGTAVTKGKAKLYVTDTGVNTKLGKIATQIREAKKEKTPLEIELDFLGRILGIVFVAVCAIVFIFGFIKGTLFQEMLLISISLAVAAIPEGLPAVVTIVLAIGVLEMAHRNAVVKNLPAVETLGAVTFICTDKTGTLTQNKMKLVKVYEKKRATEDGSFDSLLSQEIKRAMVLCNDATKEMGDPTEVALIDCFDGEFIEEIRNRYPRVFEIPFTSESKRMTTIHKFESNYLAVSKGATEIILDLCSKEFNENNEVINFMPNRKKEVLSIAEGFAAAGLRVLAIAEKPIEHFIEKEEDIEKDLTFLGLLCLKDPLREEAKVAVEECRRAGIKPVMITGDHKITAYSIAQELGFPVGEVITSTDMNKMDNEELSEIIENISIFARINPLDKLRIVEAFQKKGEVVAMTGDGVNDAPALKKSDIGVAMGVTGTEVAKEASDMVLMDDNFATLVHAVFQGRIIYENMRKFIVYLLSCNIAEVLVMFLAIVIGAPPPLLPLQLLWLNLVTDSFPALALGMEKGEENIMKKSPRGKNEPLLTRYHYGVIITQSIAITAVTLSAFFIAFRRVSLEEARTIAYFTLVLSELFRSFTARSFEMSIFKLKIFSNKFLTYSTIVMILLLLVSIYLTPFAKLFGNVRPTTTEFTYIIVLSLTPSIVSEIAKIVRKEE
jgi:Ca2+-transporting ATPase